MRLLIAAIAASAMVGAAAPPAYGQVETLLFDHVHMAVPDPQAAARWYHEHLGGEYVDGRDDRLLFGTTRVVFLRGEGRNRSEGSAVDHLGFSVLDLATKLVELERAGAKITMPLREVSGLFKISFLDDPWGTRLEVIEDEQHLGFHHIHLRAADPEQALGWYHEHFGGVRTPMRGMRDGILYPGNVWLLVLRGEAAPSVESTIDHIGWRAIDLESKVEEFRRRGLMIETEPQLLTLPNGTIHFAYVTDPAGGRIELVQRAPDMR